MSKYVQLTFSRTDGRSWTIGMTGYGDKAVAKAREMARTLSQSPACDFIEVVIETRKGALTTDSKVHNWSRKNGWS